MFLFMKSIASSFGRALPVIPILWLASGCFSYVMPVESTDALADEMDGTSEGNDIASDEGDVPADQVDTSMDEMDALTEETDASPDEADIPADDAADGEADVTDVTDATDEDLPPDVCLPGPLLETLARDHILVGAEMEDATSDLAPFDFRHMYLAGGLFDGDAPCTSCASFCTAGGVDCSNSGPGCAWWGCWQYDVLAPGQYLIDFLGASTTRGIIPMITYLELGQTSGADPGDPLVLALSDVALMHRYFADWRFMLETIGYTTAFVHHEPGLWGHAQIYARDHAGGDPHAVIAAVASANPVDCGAMENSLVGLADCLISMARLYAPYVKVGFHAASWASGPDPLYNTVPAVDVTDAARQVGLFLLASGAGGGDFVAVAVTDMDAALGDTLGMDLWWDDTNATLPNFHQAFSWAGALTESVGLPILWWDMPIGNMALPDVSTRWRDNRLDYFFAHMDEVAGSHAFGVCYGTSTVGATTPETDGGNLVARTLAYDAAGGQDPCP